MRADEISARVYIQIKYNFDVTRVIWGVYKKAKKRTKKKKEKKAKSVLRPPGCNVLCLKIILASKRRLSWVSRKPERITDTSISVQACLGDAKCRPTGRSVLDCRVERRCSLKRSPRRLPVSPM